MKETVDGVGKRVKEKAGTRHLEHPINHNRIRTVASARNKVAAASLLRGRTTNLIQLDEFAWAPYNQIFYNNMIPAYKTIANNCKAIGCPYGIHITTTPGLLTTDEGKYANIFRKQATEFQENWYDLSKQEIDNIIDANDNSNFVYIRYTYQQLGKDEKWFKDMCKEMSGNWVDIRREILLEWSDINEECPYSREDLDTIKAMLRNPINVILIFNKYPFKIYEMMNFSRSIPIMGVDVSAGVSRDASTIVIIDSVSTRVTATFECNYISTVEFAAVIQEITLRYMPNAVINIERNGVANRQTSAYIAIYMTLGVNCW